MTSITLGSRRTHPPPWQIGVAPAQAQQAAPFPPQDALFCCTKGMQVMPSQHPAQLDELHWGGGMMQLPWLHSCPVGHWEVEVS
jgi:hypothetical protein